MSESDLRVGDVPVVSVVPRLSDATVLYPRNTTPDLTILRLRHHIAGQDRAIAATQRLAAKRADELAQIKAEPAHVQIAHAKKELSDFQALMAGVVTRCSVLQSLNATLEAEARRLAELLADRENEIAALQGAAQGGPGGSGAPTSLAPSSTPAAPVEHPVLRAIRQQKR